MQDAEQPGHFPPPRRKVAASYGATESPADEPSTSRSMKRMPTALIPSAIHDECFLRNQAVDLQEDTYSWLLLMLVKHWHTQDCDMDETSVLGEVTDTSLWHATFVWAFSVVLELCVVVFFWVANIELGAKVSDEYFQQKYHMGVHNAAEALQQAAADGVAYTPPDILQACAQQAAWANMGWIYYVTLTFWLMTMVTEIKESVWIAIHIVGVQNKPAYDENGQRNRSSLLYEDAEHDQIVCLQTWHKGLLLFIVPAFRIVIGLVLTYTGAKYLILSTKVTEMVVKTVALQFVIKMDNVAAESLLTMGDLDELRRVKIRTNYGHPHRDSVWDKGLGGMFYIAIIVSTMVVLTQVQYGDVLAFRSACGAYHEHFKIDGVTDMMGIMFKRFNR
jgi:hypothetical protein